MSAHPDQPQSAGQQRSVAGRYLLERPVGRGGMGTVWLAHDSKLDRAVAIKEVSYPEAVSEQERQLLEQRTMREARSAARLSSPRTTTVHDVVDEGGRPWIVMEYVESRTLGQLVSEHGPLPPADVARIGLDLLDALEAAHTVDVVHRDVKPGNVLLDGAGRAWLTDFGIATSVGDETLSDQGVLLGSPSFMAPERARGEEAGPFADLWSLGATLYAAVEGKGPFDRGEPMATLLAVTVEPPTPPARAGALTPVLLGLLAKEPDERMTGWQAREALQAAVAQTGPSHIGSAWTGSAGTGSVPGQQASMPPTSPPPTSPPPTSPPPGMPPPQDAEGARAATDTGPDRVHRIDRDEIARLAGLAGRSFAKGAAKAAVAGLSAWHESGSDGTQGSRRRAAAAGVRETASELSRAYRASKPSEDVAEPKPDPSRSQAFERPRPEPVPPAYSHPFRKPLVILGLIVGGLVLGVALLIALLIFAAS